jgi:hypothetical protein
VSTVAEIKQTIEKLSPGERAELESLVWLGWDRVEGDTPPGIRETLTEAANGRFHLGARSNLEKFPSSLG